VFLSCGDSLFDMFVAGASRSGEASGEASGQGSGQGNGDKQIDNTRVSVEGVVGGSPMNVALGMARFGHTSRYLTKLSSDLFGNRIAQFLDINSVDRSLCVPTDLNSTLAMVETQADGSAQYAFYINNTADVALTVGELPAALPEDVGVLHFGSYSTAVEPVAGSLMHLAARESLNRVISYDPNLRLSIEPNVAVWKASFEKFAASANLIKASDEDIASLYGKNREDNFVADCFSHGAQLVYITRGPDGGSAFSADGDRAATDGVSVNVVDTVGAGDTFQAAILHWLADQKHVGRGAAIEGRVDLQSSLAFAAKAAAITCSRRGADLPVLSDLS